MQHLKVKKTSLVNYLGKVLTSYPPRLCLYARLGDYWATHNISKQTREPHLNGIRSGLTGPGG
jgi:hypothetical protein